MPDPIAPPAGAAESKPASGQPTPPAPPAPATPPATPPAAAPDDKGNPPAKVVPEKYDLKVEGSFIDPATLEQRSASFKARGLTNEEAQAEIENEAKTIQAYVEKKQQEVIDAKTQEWSKSWETDKEIGGETFKQNAELAKRVVDRFGSPELKEALNKSGLGNHPELGRLLVRIGKAMSEDQLVLPGTQPGPKKDPATLFYGENPNQ